jgi:hypothetical protein
MNLHVDNIKRRLSDGEKQLFYKIKLICIQMSFRAMNLLSRLHGIAVKLSETSFGNAKNM